jgi:nucleoside 2-deoxyribosyltransferase
MLTLQVPGDLSVLTEEELASVCQAAHVALTKVLEARSTQPRTLYLAGTIHHPQIKDGTIQRKIQDLGYNLTSRWHDPAVWQENSREESLKNRRAIALANFGDLDLAGAVVAIPLEGHHLRGMHTEIGYAVAKGKTVFVLGDHNSLNTMTVHPKVKYIQGLPDLG